MICFGTAESCLGSKNISIGSFSGLVSATVFPVKTPGCLFSMMLFLSVAIRLTEAEQDSVDGRLTAPMPGKIVAVMVSDGEQVKLGTPLVVLEAMKMEHTISAPADGMVVSLPFAVGDMVSEGAELLSFEVAEDVG